MEKGTKPNDFYLRLLKVCEGLDYLQKDKKNDYANYNYVSEAKLKSAVRKLLIENKIVFLYSTTSSRTDGKVVYVHGTWKLVDATDPAVREEGEWEGSGANKGDKDLYTAITGGIKYVLNTNFLIPTGDDPEKDDPVKDEAVHTQPISTAQVKQIMELLTKKTVKQSWFKDFGIESRENITSGKKTNGSMITETEGTAIIQAMLKLEDKKTTPPVTPA